MARKRATRTLSGILRHVILYPFSDSKPIVVRGYIIDISPELAQYIGGDFLKSYECGPDDKPEQLLRPVEFSYDKWATVEFDEFLTNVLILNRNILPDVTSRLLKQRQKLVDVIEMFWRHNLLNPQGRPDQIRLMTYARTPPGLLTIADFIGEFLWVEPIRTKHTLSIRGSTWNVKVIQQLLPIVRALSKQKLNELSLDLRERCQALHKEKGLIAA